MTRSLSAFVCNLSAVSQIVCIRDRKSICLLLQLSDYLLIISRVRGIDSMGESKSKYSGQKWTVQLTTELADKAELARRFSGLSRQELLEAALDEYISAHLNDWQASLQQLVASDNKAAKK